MVRYINQLICMFMNINENCKNKVEIIKNSLKIFQVVSGVPSAEAYSGSKDAEQLFVQSQM